MSRRIKGLWLGLAISGISLVSFGAVFGGAFHPVVSALFGVLLLPTLLLGGLMVMLVGPIGEIPYLFLAVGFIGQFACYPTAGYWLGKWLDAKAKRRAGGQDS